MNRYLKSGEICKELRITPMTLKRWKDKDLIKFKQITSKKILYDIHSVDKIAYTNEQRLNVVYSRVSNSKQKDDLLRQTNYIKEFMIKNGIKPNLVIEDIASGMNENRNGFNQLLNLVFDNKIDTIYISYKDRLTRFGFDYFINIFARFNTKIEIINLTDESSFQNELSNDFISIIHHFSMKLYFNRRKKFKEIEIKLKEIEKEE